MDSTFLLAKLFAIYPSFRDNWNSEDNLFVGEEEQPTLCGVFAQFSHWFSSSPAALSSPALKEVASLINQCCSVADSPEDNAAATCFLENIAGSVAAASLAPLLLGNAASFLAQFTHAA